VLLESGEFKEAELLAASKKYKKLIRKDVRLVHQFSQYYFQNNLQKAKVILEDSLPRDRHYFRKTFLYAKLKDTKKIPSNV
jgi:hypothetical protein